MPFPHRFENRLWTRYSSHMPRQIELLRTLFCDIRMAHMTTICIDNEESDQCVFEGESASILYTNHEGILCELLSVAVISAEEDEKLYGNKIHTGTFETKPMQNIFHELSSFEEKYLGCAMGYSDHSERIHPNYRNFIPFDPIWFQFKSTLFTMPGVIGTKLVVDHFEKEVQSNIESSSLGLGVRILESDKEYSIYFALTPPTEMESVDALVKLLRISKKSGSA